MRVNRLYEIEQYLIQHRSASLEELATQFDVSLNTVRRDIKELIARGKLEKVYGGVVLRSRQETVQPLSVRSQQNLAGKRCVGELAASLVTDNSAIFIDSGSTTPHILPFLSERRNVTIISHSLPALYEASKYPNLNIISLGGIFNFSTASYLDIASADKLSRITIDSVFVAATGVSVENGLTNSTYLEAELKREIIKRTKNVILLADQSKFSRSAVITFCRFRDINHIVTDHMPDQKFMEAIQAYGIDLLCPKE